MVCSGMRKSITVDQCQIFNAIFLNPLLHVHVRWSYNTAWFNLQVIVKWCLVGITGKPLIVHYMVCSVMRKSITVDQCQIFNAIFLNLLLHVHVRWSYNTAWFNLQVIVKWCLVGITGKPLIVHYMVCSVMRKSITVDQCQIFNAIFLNHLLVALKCKVTILVYNL